MCCFIQRYFSSNPGRRLNSSQSDEFIFEHPEVTIRPSELDDEIQRRLLTTKSSSTNENFDESDEGQSAPNVLEHPDMRSPVVMQSQQMSSSASTSSFLIDNNLQQSNQTQSSKRKCTLIESFLVQ